MTMTVARLRSSTSDIRGATFDSSQTALVLEMGDSAAELSGVPTLINVILLFYRAKSFVKRHWSGLQVTYDS